MDKNLNARQQEAVTHKDGPLLVVAGAGTGKTRVITNRIAHLIENGVLGRQILAVTFTNKAASEMKDRVSALISAMNRDQFANLQTPFIGTFHSLGVHILKESGRAIGIGRWFTIYDRDDSASLVRKCLKQAGYDPKQFTAGSVLGAISRAKGAMHTPLSYKESASPGFYTDLLMRVWPEYDKGLRAQEALDFDDLLLKTAELLRDYEDVRKYYQDKWRYIHVDEFQDTNAVQYEMIRNLISPDENLCVVGDMDQTIYTWRGATIENITGFEKDFPKAKVVILEENYRSTGNILDAANQIIAKNKTRKDKNLFTSIGAGAKITLNVSMEPGEEARFVTNTVRGIIKGGVRPEECAVLYRANFQSRALEESFLTSSIPYTVVGTRFFDRAEIKDTLAYVKSALNPLDQASVARAASSPKRGLGDKTLESHFIGDSSDKMQNFMSLLSDLREHLLASSLPDALKYVVNKSGYEEMLKKAGDEGLERLENIRELINLASKYKGLTIEEGLEKFLTEAGLASDQDALLHEDKKKMGVRLMTVHAAKGLEFRYVFIVGLEQGLFPHERMDEEGMSVARQEEERRLFYVAVTRAKEKLYLSYCQFRSMYGEQRVAIPSEYLADIDETLIDQAEIVSSMEYGRYHGAESEVSETGFPTKRGYLPEIEDIT